MSILSLLLTSAVLGAPMTFAPDRMAVVYGQRTFILGLYENPKEDRVLKDVAEAGFNLVSMSADQAGLDRLRAHGLYAWIVTGSQIDLSAERAGRETALKEMAGQFASHPALLVWEVPDEALWNCWYDASLWRRDGEPKQQRELIGALADKALADKLTALREEADRHARAADYAASEAVADSIWKMLGKEQPRPGLDLSKAAQRAATMRDGMVQGYQLLKSLDPQHPIWMNFAPRNQPSQLAAFAEGADVVGCDIYPVPASRSGHSDLMDQSLSSVGAYTVRMQQAGPGKPVWMVLQGFGWSDIQPNLAEAERKVRRRPTFDESRFMAYDAIVNGARGILYWGTAYVEKDSEFWKDLLKLVRELADLQPVLSAPDAPLSLTVTYDETWGSVDRGIRVLPKTVDGAVWLLVVNEWPEPLRYTLHGLDTLEGKTYRDTQTEAAVSVKAGAFSMGIPGCGVQVLSPGR